MRELLARLRSNLQRLENFRKMSPSGIDGWSLRYGFYESIQIMIDICCHLVNRLDLGVPESYRECVKKLVQAGHLPEDLGERLMVLVQFRNLLAHVYARLEDEEVHKKLDYLDDLYRFLEVVEGYF
ncbi:DUF86 domain-containing protein [Thermosulfurimonas sp. F29]|uniref:type VII toxin-antitoxin system HepT family RNase toxin n=1 Tax=Thermosulfurimonas sp. F29 TaxID=2867247 RepID=UPI002102CE75|nr:DUF86 domain-containing protein [Thermosulfurimonas sp. F29]